MRQLLKRIVTAGTDMKQPIFRAKKHCGLTSPPKWGRATSRAIDPIIFTPACQFLPGFHIIPRLTPWEREGRWVVIDF